MCYKGTVSLPNDLNCDHVNVENCMPMLCLYMVKTRAGSLM